MSAWDPGIVAALGGLAIGFVFGAVAHATAFCSSGAILDQVRSGDGTRLRAWVLAMAVAILGTQLLLGLNIMDVSKAAYLTSPVSLAGPVLGGVMFGVGLILAQGCGARHLVRLGGGNLRALVVILVFAVVAYATMRGLLAPGRVHLERLTQLGLRPAGVPELLSGTFGLTADVMRWTLALSAATLLATFALGNAAFRSSPRNVVAGVVVGSLIAAGWYVTGVLAQDEFKPTPPASLTFVAPLGDSLQYVMLFTGLTANFGTSLVGGVVLGAFLAALARGRFQFEGFDDQRDFARHLAGAALMGAGGVLAMGCTVGQGLTGLSTLSLTSIVAVLSITAGGFVAAQLVRFPSVNSQIDRTIQAGRGGELS